MRKVIFKDYHRLADQCDLDGSSLQLGQAHNGHYVMDYTPAEQDGCAATGVGLSVLWRT